MLCSGKKRLINDITVETVVLLNNKFSKANDFVEISVDAEDYYRIKDSEKGVRVYRDDSKSCGCKVCICGFFCESDRMKAHPPGTLLFS